VQMGDNEDQRDDCRAQQSKQPNTLLWTRHYLLTADTHPCSRHSPLRASEQSELAERIRLEAGHHSELKPATPRESGVKGLTTTLRVSDSGNQPFLINEEVGVPAKRELTMRQLRYMLRLHHDGVSAREIGRTLGIARSTIQDNLRRAQAIGIAWPVPAELTDGMLEQRLFARAGVKMGLRRRSEPDWATLARELKRPGVSPARSAGMTAAAFYAPLELVTEFCT
jgi:hypothetical protein